MQTKIESLQSQLQFEVHKKSTMEVDTEQIKTLQTINQELMQKCESGETEMDKFKKALVRSE